MGRARVAGFIFVACAIACGDATFSGSQDGDSGADAGTDATRDDAAPDSSADGGITDAQVDGEVLLFSGSFGPACSPWSQHNASLTLIVPDGGPPICEVCATSDDGYAGVTVAVPSEDTSGTFVYTTQVAADPVTDPGGLFYWNAFMEVDFADAAPYFPNQQGTSDASFSAAQISATVSSVADIQLVVNDGVSGGTPTGECFLFAEPRLTYVPSP